MIGSEKQVAWAEKIKAALLKDVVDEINNYEGRKAGLVKQGKPTAGADKVISRYRLAKDLLEKEQNAEKIINQRSSGIESTIWFREAEGQVPRR